MQSIGNRERPVNFWFVNWIDNATRACDSCHRAVLQLRPPSRVQEEEDCQAEFLRPLGGMITSVRKEVPSIPETGYHPGFATVTGKLRMTRYVL